MGIHYHLTPKFLDGDPPASGDLLGIGMELSFKGTVEQRVVFVFDTTTGILGAVDESGTLAQIRTDTELLAQPPSTRGQGSLAPLGVAATGIGPDSRPERLGPCSLLQQERPAIRREKEDRESPMQGPRRSVGGPNVEGAEWRAALVAHDDVFGMGDAKVGIGSWSLHDLLLAPDPLAVRSLNEKFRSRRTGCHCGSELCRGCGRCVRRRSLECS